MVGITGVKEFAQEQKELWEITAHLPAIPVGRKLISFSFLASLLLADTKVKWVSSEEVLSEHKVTENLIQMTFYR